MRVTTLTVDFNDIDDDVVEALWPEGQAAGEPGSQYHLIDGDGNYIRGRLVSIVNRIARLTIDWDTWRPGSAESDPVREFAHSPTFGPHGWSDNTTTAATGSSVSGTWTLVDAG